MPLRACLTFNQVCSWRMGPLSPPKQRRTMDACHHRRDLQEPEAEGLLTTRSCPCSWTYCPHSWTYCPHHPVPCRPVAGSPVEMPDLGEEESWQTVAGEVVGLARARFSSWGRSAAGTEVLHGSLLPLLLNTTLKLREYLSPSPSLMDSDLIGPEWRPGMSKEKK